MEISSTPAPRRSPSALRATWTNRLIVALTVLAYITIGAVVIYALSRVSNAVVVLLISALLAYIIYPFIHFLNRFMPRPLAVALAYVIVVAVIGVILYYVIISIVQQSASSVQAIQALFSPEGQRRLQPIRDFLGQLGISQQQINSYQGQLLGFVRGFVGQVIPFLRGFFTNLITSIIIITLSIYFVLDGPRVTNWLVHKTPLAYRETAAFLVSTFDRSVGGYFRGLLILSTIGAICTGVVLSLLRVPYGALLGLVFFFLFFIPMIGGYISSFLCILAAIPTGWVTVLIVIVFTILLQQIVLGQVLAPRIFSHSIGLHPIIALSALLAGGQLFGVLGGFFSVPLAGVVQEVVSAVWKRWKQRHPEQFEEPEIPPTSLSSAHTEDTTTTPSHSS